MKDLVWFIVGMWNGGMLEEVEQFCCLQDVLDCGAGVERAVQARVTAA